MTDTCSRRGIPRSLWLAGLVVVPAAVGVACGGSPAAPSPFAPNNEAGAGGEAGAAPVPTGTVPDPMLGGPCVDFDQCDDDIDCTDDSCDTELGRCRFSPVHTRCGDDVYCNGGEICVVGVGCDAGEPVSCSDGSSCTIDVCVEATRKCESRPRDADGDGDPIRNCGGGDCRDDDPNVNSSADEVCRTDSTTTAMARSTSRTAPNRLTTPARAPSRSRAPARSGSRLPRRGSTSRSGA